MTIYFLPSPKDTIPDLVKYYENSSFFWTLSGVVKSSPSMGFRFRVSGVGRKGERSDNQELDPLEKTLGHKVAEHQRHRQVDK